MKKIFNMKIMKLYIVLLCVSMVAGIVCGGFCISFSSELAKLEQENKPSVSDALAETLTNMLASAATGGEASDAGGKEDEKLTVEQTKLQKKKTICTVAMIVSFVLASLFSVATITSYQYDKYLKSYKYEAKLKRLKKYEKAKKANKLQ